MQFAITSALVQTTTHQLATTHQAQRNVSATCFCQGFPGSWQFFLEGCRASHRGSKYTLSPTVWLNHTRIHKHLINTALFNFFLMLVDTFLDTLVCKNCLVLLWAKKRYKCLAWYRMGVLGIV